MQISVTNKIILLDKYLSEEKILKQFSQQVVKNRCKNPRIFSKLVLHTNFWSQNLNYFEKKPHKPCNGQNKPFKPNKQIKISHILVAYSHHFLPAMKI